MTVSWDDPPLLRAFNDRTDVDALRAELLACCAATSYANWMVDGRPYGDIEALLLTSDDAVANLGEVGLAEALAAHPRIGERVSGPEAAWSRQEQSAVSSADADVLAQLREANAQYERKFGHVYLVFATGKSADEMLAICRTRLDNDPVTEHGIVLAELAKITRLRLGKLLNPVNA